MTYDELRRQVDLIWAQANQTWNDEIAETFHECNIVALEREIDKRKGADEEFERVLARYER